MSSSGNFKRAPSSNSNPFRESQRLYHQEGPSDASHSHSNEAILEEESHANMTTSYETPNQVVEASLAGHSSQEDELDQGGE